MTETSNVSFSPIFMVPPLPPLPICPWNVQSLYCGHLGADRVGEAALHILGTSTHVRVGVDRSADSAPFGLAMTGRARPFQHEAMTVQNLPHCQANSDHQS